MAGKSMLSLSAAPRANCQPAGVCEVPTGSLSQQERSKTPQEGTQQAEPQRHRQSLHSNAVIKLLDQLSPTVLSDASTDQHLFSLIGTAERCAPYAPSRDSRAFLYEATCLDACLQPP